ncbi:MAG: dTDP-4-dehydrorhamnose reductase [Maledivibacter sp.]|jgi:dTDP-4-dehydrorhamnose reductase|nr:dTDP-4-dehydrorhamnose reductase [Maledivibacter sp.]
MKIALIGAQGQLGSDIIRANNEFCYEIISLNHRDIEITDFENSYSALKVIKPEVIINTAAFHNVEVCEKEVERAYRVNSIGARNLGVIANELNSKLVHISTDYVFDGIKKDTTTGYMEFHNPNPINIYGKSKLFGEELLKSVTNKYYILRTAWLYGDGGSKSKGGNFVRKMLELSKGQQELKVVDDQIGTPTNTYYLAKQILELIKYPYYGTYHATCEGNGTWYEFALEIFKAAKIKIIVNPVGTKEFQTIAQRPKNSVLENHMLKIQDLNIMPDWREALKEYMDKLLN